MKSERAWAGIICGFFLFIVVCLSLLLHMKGAFSANGQPRAWTAVLCATRRRGELFIPRKARHTSADWRHAGGTGLSGGDADVLYYSSIVFGRELAWLFSAVFWCALGALCFFYLFASGWTPDAGTQRKSEVSQANRPRFSFARASKSVQPPMCF